MDDQEEKPKPTIYRLGKKETDGHTHLFYLRDHLPLITDDADHHAHMISQGKGNTMLCASAPDHNHTKLSVINSGDYMLRGLVVNE